MTAKLKGSKRITFTLNKETREFYKYKPKHRGGFVYGSIYLKCDCCNDPPHELNIDVDISDKEGES